MQSVVLLDGNNTFWRANSVTDLHDASGNRVSGIFGTLRIIRSLIERFKPTEFVVVWDGGRSESRKTLFPEYKKKPPIKEEEKEEAEFRRQEFFRQIEELLEVIPMFGVRQVKLPHTEADDVISMLSIELADLNFQPIIVSTDNDYLQMLQLDAPILVFSPVKNLLYDKSAFVHEFGFTPDRMLEYKAMIGDGSDGIPGINGIGGKTAQTVVQKYTSLAEAVRDHADELRKSKKLAKIVDEYQTIVRNMELMNLLVPCVPDVTRLSIDSLETLLASPIEPIEYSRIQRFLVKHSFQSILRDFNNWIAEFDQQVVRSKLGGL